MTGEEPRGMMQRGLSLLFALALWLPGVPAPAQPGDAAGRALQEQWQYRDARPELASGGRAGARVSFSVSYTTPDPPETVWRFYWEKATALLRGEPAFAARLAENPALLELEPWGTHRARGAHTDDAGGAGLQALLRSQRGAGLGQLLVSRPKERVSIVVSRPAGAAETTILILVEKQE